MIKIITGDPTTDMMLEHQKIMFNHFFKTTEADDMSLATIEKKSSTDPTAQIDIAILSDGKCITETTLDVFAEWDEGDSSTGAAKGMVVNAIMLGNCDITNEMDLNEIQEYMRETL